MASLPPSSDPAVPPSSDPAVRAAANDMVARLKKVARDKVSFDNLMRPLQSASRSSPSPPTQARHHPPQQAHTQRREEEQEEDEQQRDGHCQTAPPFTVQNGAVTSVHGDQCEWLARCEQLRRRRAQEIERLGTLPSQVPGDAKTETAPSVCCAASAGQHTAATRDYVPADGKHARQHPHATPSLVSAFDRTTGTLDLSNFDFSDIGR